MGTGRNGSFNFSNEISTFFHNCNLIELVCNNKNNNINDNIYGAVIVAKATARVHPVHVMNVARRQAAADPQTRPNDLGCESACRLPETTPTIAIYYYYSARKLILILPSHEG